MAAVQIRSKPPSASAQAPAPPAAVHGVWWKMACGLLMAYVIYGAFFIANGAVGFGRSGNPARIVFFHVPAAILSSVCYFVGMVYAALYLWKRADLDTDAKSAIAMELGFLFCILATVTGSIFAGTQWGSFWNWDPREISIVIMLLLYASYLILRAAVERRETRARLSAVYAIVALVPAQFLIWVVPRIPALGSMHPVNVIAKGSATSLSYKAVLYPSFLAFTLLFLWLFQLRYRLYKVVTRRTEQG